MGRVLIFAVSFLFLAADFSYTDQIPPSLSILDPEQLLKSLVSEVQDIRMVTPEDLEPNPQGKYRRHAFIQGDFNRNGQEDIAICATDRWTRGRNAYVLIASKRKNGTWYRAFFHKFPGIAQPFLIWDKEKMALLVGANFSDSNPGDIVWDRAKKEYKLLQVIEK